MRNNNFNQKGNTNVNSSDRVFDSTKAGISDSNKEWSDFQPYYDEDQYQAKETKKSNYEAVERGRAFTRGQLILLALREEADKKIRAHQREMETA